MIGLKEALYNLRGNIAGLKRAFLWLCVVVVLTFGAVVAWLIVEWGG